MQQQTLQGMSEPDWDRIREALLVREERLKSMSRPRWSQIQQFFRVQGYKEVRTTHWQYEKIVTPGFMSWTQHSFSKLNEQIGSHMWKRVWHDQLQLAGEDEFWTGLQGQAVRYNMPPAPAIPEPLPRYLETFLRDVEHLIPSLTRETV